MDNEKYNNEQWKDLVFDGTRSRFNRYQISNMGRIRQTNRKVPLKPFVNSGKIYLQAIESADIDRMFREAKDSTRKKEIIHLKKINRMLFDVEKLYQRVWVDTPISDNIKVGGWNKI